MSDDQDFSKVVCDVPGFETAWVKFKTSGYPFSLRKRWDAASTDEAVGIIAEYIVDGEFPNASGGVLSLNGKDNARRIEVLDKSEDAVVAWLIRTFRAFWLVTLVNARPNS